MSTIDHTPNHTVEFSLFMTAFLHKKHELAKPEFRTTSLHVISSDIVKWLEKLEELHATNLVSTLEQLGTHIESLKKFDTDISNHEKKTRSELITLYTHLKNFIARAERVTSSLFIDTLRSVHASDVDVSRYVEQEIATYTWARFELHDFAAYLVQKKNMKSGFIGSRSSIFHKR